MHLLCVLTAPSEDDAIEEVCTQVLGTGGVSLVLLRSFEGQVRAPTEGTAVGLQATSSSSTPPSGDPPGEAVYIRLAHVSEWPSPGT
jgi:hypothetical protein